jgi:murein DD-endopeptidase MepM/ murein hydrolase activator NlpD
MTYWGWRVAFGSVCICVCILLIACSETTPTPLLTPTEFPSITLTLWLAATAPPLLPTVIPMTATSLPVATQTAIVYTVQPGDSLVEIAADFGAAAADLQAANLALQTAPPHAGDQLTIPISPSIPTLTPQPLALQPPTCYLTTTDNLTCLGTIHNPQAEPMRRVTAKVELYAEDGTLVASQLAGIEQRSIPPGESAPYRALFVAHPITSLTTYSQVIVSLQSAEAAVNASSTAVLQPLQIQAETANFEQGVYHLTIELANPGAYPLVDGRVVLTVSDAYQRVVGYRVVELSDFAPQAVQKVQVMVLPLGDNVHTPLLHHIYAEAWAAASEAASP